MGEKSAKDELWSCTKVVVGAFAIGITGLWLLAKLSDKLPHRGQYWKRK